MITLSQILSTSERTCVDSNTETFSVWLIVCNKFNNSLLPCGSNAEVGSSQTSNCGELRMACILFIASEIHRQTDYKDNNI